MNNRKIQRREVKRSQPVLIPVNVTTQARKIPSLFLRHYPMRVPWLRRNTSLTGLWKAFRE